MRIAICDDNEQDLKKLYQVLTNYANQHQLSIDIDCFSDGTQLLDNFYSGKYKICFLDIHMEKLNGIETAQKLREIDDDFSLIFITHSHDYALIGYELHAIGYFLKPLEKLKFIAFLDWYFAQLPKTSPYIEVMCERKTLHIPIKSILYAEVYDKQTSIHTDTAVYLTWISLTELSKILNRNENQYFSHCHRSYLVNLCKVAYIEGMNFILFNQEAIPISKRNLAAMRKEWSAFLSDKNRGGVEATFKTVCTDIDNFLRPSTNKKVRP